jgi:hypothetical protein
MAKKDKDTDLNLMLTRNCSSNPNEKNILLIQNSEA